MDSDEFKRYIMGTPIKYDKGAIDLWCCYYWLTDTHDAEVCSVKYKGEPHPVNSEERKESNRFSDLVMTAIEIVAIDNEIEKDEFLQAKREVRDRYDEELMLMRIGTSTVLVNVVEQMVRLRRKGNSADIDLNII